MSMLLQDIRDSNFNDRNASSVMRNELTDRKQRGLSLFANSRWFTTDGAKYRQGRDRIGTVPVDSDPSRITHHALRFFLLFFICGLLLSASFAYAQEQAPKGAQPARQGTLATGQGTLEEERLNILKNDIQKEMGEYKQLRNEIDDAQKTLAGKNREMLKKVAKMYESMSPEDAAKKMEKLDEGIAVSILTTLKPKSAGKILAQMEDEKAANLSQRMLERGKDLQEKTSP